MNKAYEAIWHSHHKNTLFVMKNEMQFATKSEHFTTEKSSDMSVGHSCNAKKKHIVDVRFFVGIVLQSLLKWWMCEHTLKKNLKRWFKIISMNILFANSVLLLLLLLLFHNDVYHEYVKAKQLARENLYMHFVWFWHNISSWLQFTVNTHIGFEEKHSMYRFKSHPFATKKKLNRTHTNKTEEK